MIEKYSSWGERHPRLRAGLLALGINLAIGLTLWAVAVFEKPLPSPQDIAAAEAEAQAAAAAEEAARPRLYRTEQGLTVTEVELIVGSGRPPTVVTPGTLPQPMAPTRPLPSLRLP